MVSKWQTHDDHDAHKASTHTLWTYTIFCGYEEKVIPILSSFYIYLSPFWWQPVLFRWETYVTEEELMMLMVYWRAGLSMPIRRSYASCVIYTRETGEDISQDKQGCYNCYKSFRSTYFKRNEFVSREKYIIFHKHSANLCRYLSNYGVIKPQSKTRAHYLIAYCISNGVFMYRYFMKVKCFVRGIRSYFYMAY